MDVSKFSERAREALETAQGVVRRGPGNMLGTEHLLIGVLSLPGGIVEQILNLLGIDKGAAMTRANQFAQNQPVGSGPPGAAPADMLYLTPRAKAAIDIAVQQSQKMQRRVRRHRAPAARHLPRGRGSRQRHPQGPRHDRGEPAAGARRGARHRRRLRGQRDRREHAQEVHARPHGARPRRPPRPGDRPRRRDQAGHPGAQPAHQEQPRPDRRARRGQDGHRRGSRPEDRGRRRARDAARQARAVARPRGDGRRRQVPRRVRGAPQGRARRGPARQGRRAVHRRAPQRRGRRRGRGRDRRLEPDEAHARPRRAAVRRARPPSTSTASTSKRTRPSSAASSPSSSASRASRRRSRSCAACATSTRPTTR